MLLINLELLQSSKQFPLVYNRDKAYKAYKVSNRDKAYKVYKV
jgi:hypothetical protein